MLIPASSGRVAIPQSAAKFATIPSRAQPIRLSLSPSRARTTSATRCSTSLALGGSPKERLLGDTLRSVSNKVTTSPALSPSAITGVQGAPDIVNELQISSFLRHAGWIINDKRVERNTAAYLVIRKRPEPLATVKGGAIGWPRVSAAERNANSGTVNGPRTRLRSGGNYSGVTGVALEAILATAS